MSAPDARTLTIQPYDKNAIAGIEKAIMEANLGLTPRTTVPSFALAYHR